jgi:gas vesicle protein
MVKNESTPVATVATLALAVGVGYLLGVLFAPRSGKQTREKLAQRAEELKKHVQREV